MPSKFDEIEKWEPDDYDKDLLKATWSSDFDFLYNLGSNIYTYIFNHSPHTKQLFPSIHCHGDQWKDSKEFRTQALKFVQALSQCIKSLYNMNSLAKYLYNIGERHVKFSSRGFKPEYWDIFQDAIEYSLTDHISSIKELGDQQKADAKDAWRKMALYVITHLKRGFNDHLAKESHHKH